MVSAHPAQAAAKPGDKAEPIITTDQAGDGHADAIDPSILDGP